MSKLKIDIGVELGSSLSKLKSIEDQLLKLLPATGQVTNTLKGVKDSINNIQVNKLQDVPQIFKAIIPSVNDVKKAFDSLAQTQALDRLNQAVADATASILLFSQGSASIEDLLPVLARLTQEAGGLDKGLALLQDLPNFDEFIGGLEEGVALVEKFGEAGTDINFDPNNTLTKKLKEARTNLDAVTAAFGVGSAEANQAAEAVAQINDQIKLQRDLVQGTDLAGKFELAGRALGGVASAFQTATALQAIFGDESEKTAEALKQVQSFMALTQGIQGIIEGTKAFGKLAVSIFNAGNLTKIYNAGTVVASAVTTAFGATVNATSLAFKGLAVAIASTGIGLIIVALGTLIPLLIKWISSNSAADKSLANLKKAEEELGDSIARTNDLIRQRNQAVDFNTQKAVLLARIAGKSQDEINEKERKGRLEGIALAMADRDKATNARIAQEKKNEEDLAQIRKTGSKKQIAEAEAAAKASLDLLQKDEKQKGELVTQLVQSAALKQLEAQASAADKERDNAQKANEKRIADEAKLADKLKEAKDAAGKILIDLERKNASEAQQKIFEIQDQYAEKRKTLAAAGIKDFTDINKAEAEEIARVQNDSNNQALQARKSYENALFNVIVNGVKKRKDLEAQALSDLRGTRELQFRAEISGITDAYQVRLMELKNAENKEMEALEEAYESKKISLEKFLADQAATEAFYANKKKTETEKKQEEEKKALEDFQNKYTGIIESGLEDTVAALAGALAAGEDPFAALGKVIGNSLADFAINLGKDLVVLGKLFAALKATLDTLGPGGKIAVGLALIAFGAAVKAAIGKRGKQAEKGFATGGFVSGPGTETSDSIPARLSKGEYVIRAKSVRKYGARTLEKLNKGEVPVAVMARATGRSGGSSKALVNRNEETALQDLKQILTFRDGGLADTFRQFGRSGGSSKALVNRNENEDITQLKKIFNFSNGGLVTESSRAFGRNGGTTKALVNRMAMPIPTTNIPQPNVSETFTREVPYIATTKVSGQDLRIILERADRRYSTAT